MVGGTGSAEIAPHVAAYLHERPTLTLATSSASGVPRATTLMYAGDEVDLFVWMHPESATAVQIRENSVVAFTVDEYAPDWRRIRGVQGHGECRVIINPDEVERVVAAFGEK